MGYEVSFLRVKVKGEGVVFRCMLGRARNFLGGLRMFNERRRKEKKRKRNGRETA